MDWASNGLKTLLKFKIMREKGKSFEVRLQKQTKFALNMVTPTVTNSINEAASQTMLTFLRVTSEQKVNENKIVSYVKLVKSFNVKMNEVYRMRKMRKH